MGLIGHERDKAGDEALRRGLHAQWLERQDDDAVAQLMEGVRSGFRRKRAGDLLDEDVRSCASRAEALLVACWWMQGAVLPYACHGMNVAALKHYPGFKRSRDPPGESVRCCACCAEACGRKKNLMRCCLALCQPRGSAARKCNGLCCIVHAMT